MLIQKPYTEGDTVTFKTVAGEEVVARVIQVNDEDSIKVKKPMALTLTEKGLGMVPFSLTVSMDTEMTINLRNVVFIAKTNETTAKQYIESTTGLKVVN